MFMRWGISVETCSQRFRALSTPAGETPMEMYDCLKGLYCYWIQPEQMSKYQRGEIIILEQLLQVFPVDISPLVREHEPEDRLIAATLAMHYLNARKGHHHRHSRTATPETNALPGASRPGTLMVTGGKRDKDHTAQAWTNALSTRSRVFVKPNFLPPPSRKKTQLVSTSPRF